MPSVAACFFSVLQFRGIENGKFLQGLQTANDLSVCRNQKDRAMSEYRFHLQKYRPGSKTVYPEYDRKACFTWYIDEERRISFPDNVGKCDHINSCGYHYTLKESSFIGMISISFVKSDIISNSNNGESKTSFLNADLKISKESVGMFRK